MRIAIEVLNDFSLLIDDEPPAGGRYATSGLQRGWRLMHRDEDLAEEAVGFGAPILKRGLETIFPAAVQLDSGSSAGTGAITATFHMNLVERFAQEADGVLGNGVFYAAKNLAAAAMRHVRLTRAPLTALSSWLRARFGWRTTYARLDFGADLAVMYRVDPQAGTLALELDAGGLSPDVTEVVVMHEQGAQHFEHYGDSSGLRLQADAISLWDEVHAEQAWFESRTHRVGFRLTRQAGSRLYRGRELIGNRLAWAGFGYSFAPRLGKFNHQLTLFRPS